MSGNQDEREGSEDMLTGYADDMNCIEKPGLPGRSGKVDVEETSSQNRSRVGNKEGRTRTHS